MLIVEEIFDKLGSEVENLGDGEVHGAAMSKSVVSQSVVEDLIAMRMISKRKTAVSWLFLHSSF